MSDDLSFKKVSFGCAIYCRVKAKCQETLVSMCQQFIVRGGVGHWHCAGGTNRHRQFKENIVKF